MINGSQRVIFDPAGTVRLNAVPERGDVLFGITPQVEDFYARAHARETYHVVIQEIDVTPETAESVIPSYLGRYRRHGQFHETA